MATDPADAAREKLIAAGAGPAAVETFVAQLRRVAAGEMGLIPDSELQPLGDLANAEELADVSAERAAELLGQAVVIKLNGGLGTSMGLDGPKSLLTVKDELSFLDIIARQVLHLRAETGARLPLVLMNSFSTREPSLQALAGYSELRQDVPQDFLQNKVPKLRGEDLLPVSHPANPDLEWAPPGHGDLYTALVTSGMLDELLDAGYRYAFVSNADNLGATLDLRLLDWFAELGAPFAMEAADRTEADRKGGHLALRGGTLILRETAQTASEDVEAFQDVSKYRYFNTNNLWLDLRSLHSTLEDRGGVLDLPLIVNAKTVDPKDSGSTPVLQLETAMGSAISVWERSAAIRVPRSRFGPVKTTSDLLAVRSDAYLLTAASQLTLAPEREGGPPLIELDSRYYKLVGDFDSRFPAGVPSLIDCRTLTVRGDVRFGERVSVRGDATVSAPDDQSLAIADGTELGDR